MRTAIAICYLLAAACGSVSLPGSSSDAAEGEGSIDAAAPGPVTVRVLSFDGQRTPLEGVAVGFFAPDGSHQATVETDAEGDASSDLVRGGAVVAFLEPPAGGGVTLEARAVLDVAPGDQILIGGEPSLFGDPIETMIVNLPMVTGAANYLLFTSCGIHNADSPAVPINFYPGCDTDTVSFVAVAAGDAGRVYLRHDEVPVVDEYLEPGAWQMMPTRPFPITGVPPETSSIDFGVFAVRTGDHALDLTLSRDMSLIAEEAMVTLRPERIPAFDQTLVSGIVRPEQPALGSFNYALWLGPDDDTDVALNELMLPWMGPVWIDSGSRSIAWTLAGEQEFDATYLTLITSVSDGKNIEEISWFIVAPPGIERIVLPELPADLADFYYPDPTNAYVYGQIVENDQIDGWDAARQLGFDPSYFPKREPLGSVIRSSFSGSGG